MAAMRQGIRDHLVAFGWGVAEGSFFFIVPDVWLSRVALHNPRRAVTTSCTAVAGALVGGLATYAWARKTPPVRSREVLRRLPAVSGAMIDRCERQVARSGNRAMLLGPLRGVPYKLYARAAGLWRTSLVGFVAWTPAARWPRFLLVVGLTVALRRVAQRWISRPTLDRVAPVAHAVGWTGFYAWFLATVGREEPIPVRAASAAPR